MKKGSILVIALVLILGLVLVQAPRDASASTGNIGSGAWILPDSPANFTTTNVDLAAQSAPGWLQQFSEGITILSADKICYPFRNGQFFWVPQILQLQNGVWTKIATTKETLSQEDGAFIFACSEAPSAGTYALFGYYDGPIEPKDFFTQVPTDAPTQNPTCFRTNTPTVLPSLTPTLIPTQTETEVLTLTPTDVPTLTPTDVPTETPTLEPTATLECPPNYVRVGDECIVEANK